MRTDARMDGKQVRCPNASHLGFDKPNAQVGDLVSYRYDGEGAVFTGRMLARIAYAPPICDDKEPIRNWLCVSEIAPTLDHTYERWIRPEWVVRVQTPREDHTLAMSWMTSTEVSKTAKSDIDEVRRCLTDGWRSLEAYRNWMKSR